jgi:methylase of polypeptide subunit release factors
LAKHLPGAKVCGLDISAEALLVAQLNTVLNKVDIRYFNTDVLKENTWKFNF